MGPYLAANFFSVLKGGLSKISEGETNCNFEQILEL
jgi:hypothetical protein